MKRILKLLTFAGALALTGGACTDPAAGITGGDSAPSLTEACRTGLVGPTGGRDCPPPPPG